MFHVFVRSWWLRDPSWPNGLKPHMGSKMTLARNVKTEEEARAMCEEYNRTHKPGRLSRKAEYQEQ